MTSWKRSRFSTAKEKLRDWQIEKEFKKTRRKHPLIYSQRAGVFYSLVFGLLLWWIPVAGPAVAGYLSGRKAGSVAKALTANLIATAVIVLLTFSLVPFTAGPLGFAGNYLSSGLLTLSQSKLVAASNILTDMYTGYGIIRTFAIILPSSLVTLLTFGYVGGFHSSLKTQEENYSMSYMAKNVDEKVVSKHRNAPSVQVVRSGIKEYNSGGDDSEDRYSGWSYL
ncbi:MAG TPA: hypothetical protein VJ944_02915 [Thermoplasmataceae archaeon]|nr:hypothetical protein [Thermoplasmataceae archaeon]